MLCYYWAVIHAEELPRRALKNSRRKNTKVSHPIDFTAIYWFLSCPPISKILYKTFIGAFVLWTKFRLSINLPASKTTYPSPSLAPPQATAWPTRALPGALNNESFGCH